MKVKPGTRLFPCLRVIPMGWSHALWICQKAHEFIIDSLPVINPEQRMVDRRPVPKLQDYVHTQYVDPGFA